MLKSKYNTTRKDIWSIHCKFYPYENCIPCLMFNPLSDWIMRDGKSVSSSASVLLIEGEEKKVYKTFCFLPQK